MENFYITLMQVFIMLLYSIPGYFLMKAKKVEASHIKTVSTILIYVFSPCMIIDSFLKVERTPEAIKSMLIFALVTFVTQGLMMLILFLIFRKKYEDSRYRMLTIGSVCGNVGFFGLPLVRSLLPEFPIAQAYSSIFVFTMNLLVFTIGAFCITKDLKYVSFKQAVVNPTSIALIFSIILFACGFSFSFNPLLQNIGVAVEIMGKATTPICMIILGMRLATVKTKELFNKPIIYLNIFTKQIAFPLLSFLLVYFLPLDFSFKASILILSSVPCASVILNLAEMYECNQEISANTVLLTTLASIITIPLLLLIL